MARFFFNLNDGQSYTPDPEGKILSGWTAARQHAAALMQWLVANTTRAANPVPRYTFEITNEGGSTVVFYRARELTSA